MDLPECRQCQDESDQHFGAIALAVAPDRWGIMDPKVGGYWVTDQEVISWTQLQPVAGKEVEND